MPGLFTNIHYHKNECERDLYFYYSCRSLLPDFETHTLVPPLPSPSHLIRARTYTMSYVTYYRYSTPHPYSTVAFSLPPFARRKTGLFPFTFRRAEYAYSTLPLCAGSRSLPFFLFCFYFFVSFRLCGSTPHPAVLNRSPAYTFVTYR